ncbi:hypothetical protein BDQ12DRAFT_678743 [Crucibulum laeve]|uniref:Uncharacterized protein n=1 Tax=Crucibulum laeve TaxID=68775 RepID=A0A5C3MIJ4_9AGAR|nr:hypothetical protein BDQ12DRAFT_678743 [Crucibulum laeve]
MSEIDDIFASKGKAKLLPTPKSTPLDAKPKKTKKRKTKSMIPTSDDAAPGHNAGNSVPSVPVSNKRPAPETVLDPSSSLLTIKRHKLDIDVTSEAKAKGSKPRKAKEDDTFQDSRGSGSRKKTKEGWKVYKEDELGIGDEGGGKPYCIFYAVHFTSLSYQTLLYVLLIATAVFNRCVIIKRHHMHVLLRFVENIQIYFQSCYDLGPLYFVATGTFEALPVALRI